MIICPKCKGNSKVYETRKIDNSVFRRRKCLNVNCGETWGTQEVAIVFLKNAPNMELTRKRMEALSEYTKALENAAEAKKKMDVLLSNSR